jgi:hypothetical protein|mmetsp:Transcript_5970/g.13258  ORF Transcript_5970/g.13258 Transcript_5970/m.13258 type:complete len:83 (+) Transcript_5970:1241-1489(+)
MQRFNSILSEIMLKQQIESMDVEEMIAKLNTYHNTTLTSDSSESSKKPFAPLEVKTYLQRLNAENRIFMVWDDGKMGVIYSI